ncbi:MAG: tetratricopeptide repeat protein [Desulfobacterales bacterium]
MGLLRMFAGKSPEVHEEKGDAYARQGNFGDARIEFEKALHKIETHFPEKTHLVDRITEKFNSAGQSLAAEHMENAQALARAGEVDQAEELYELALGLAIHENTRRKIEQELARLTSPPAQTEAPEPSGYESRAPDFAPEEEIAAAEADDEEMFSVLCNALPRQVAEAYQSYGDSFARGYAALNRGDFQRAVSELTRAMAENQGQTTLIPLELATAYLHTEEHARGRELLESYIEENPSEIRAYQLLCEIYWEAGEVSRAGDLLASAPEEIRHSPSMLMLIGETRFQAGDLQGADKAFKEYADTHGSDEIVIRALAKTAEAAGRIDHARDLYAQLMNQCTACNKVIDPFVKRRFAELSYESGESSGKLLDLFFSLVREDPDHRGVYYQYIGRIYEKQGENREARRYLGLSGQPG